MEIMSRRNGFRWRLLGAVVLSDLNEHCGGTLSERRSPPGA